jgi:dCTP deaminase
MGGLKLMSGAFLTDKDLAQAADAGTPFVTPFDANSVKSASIDLRIGNLKYEYLFSEYTIGSKIDEAEVRHSTYDEIWLDPGKSVYVGLLESIQIPLDVLGIVFPRNSLTRLGIAIFPVYMNPGYEGIMPITITNNGSVRIKIVPGARVAQLLCARLSGRVLKGYGDQSGSKYYRENVKPAKKDDDDLSEALQRVIKARIPSLLEQ